MEKTKSQAQAWFDELETSTQCVTLETEEDFRGDDGWQSRNVLNSFYVFPDGSVYHEKTDEDSIISEDIYDSPVTLICGLIDEGTISDDNDVDVAELFKDITTRFNFTVFNALKAILANKHLFNGYETEDIIKALTKKATASA